MPPQTPTIDFTQPPRAIDFTQPPAFKDAYGTPTDEISGFLERNPGYQYLGADPKFPNRHPGIYPSGKGSEWRTDPNNPTAQNEQWPVDLHIGKHSYQGAKLGIQGATAPLAFELSLPEILFGTGVALFGGTAGQQGAKYLGANDFQQEVAGDAGGVLGGLMTAGVTRLASSKVRALWEAIPEDLQSKLRANLVEGADNAGKAVVGYRVGKAYDGLKNAIDFWDTLGELRDRFFRTGKLTGQPAATPKPKPQPWYAHDAAGENRIPFAGGMDEYTPPKPRTMADLSGAAAPKPAPAPPPPTPQPGSAGTLAESVAKVTAKPKAAPAASTDPLLTKLRTIAAQVDADEKAQPTTEADHLAQLTEMLTRIKAGEKLKDIRPVAQTQ